ncbi:MAG: DUF1972 domain-containing protein [Aureibaculum sp.]|nr:DUF1972 domain-containing protein [Aureibaculum sp.]
MKKVFIIGSKGPYSIGGYETFVRNVGDELCKLNYDVYVTSESSPAKDSEFDFSFKPVHMFNEEKEISPMQRILYDLYAAYLTVKCNADIVYMCGYNAAWVLFLPLVFGKKIYINSDGIEWKRPSWGKNVIKRGYLIFNEFLLKVFPINVISDSKEVASYFNEKYNLASTFIAYGGDSFPPINKELEGPTLQKYSLEPGNYYFISVRIVEDNFVDKLINAFSTLKSSKLVIIGKIPDTKYGEFVKSILHENVKIIDLTSLSLEYNIIRKNAKANIHSHRFGGTSPNLLEVMCLNIPVISFDTPYAREVLLENALYYSDPDSLIKRIYEFQELSQESISSMVKNNRNRIDEFYNWKIIARQCDELFKLK